MSSKGGKPAAGRQADAIEIGLNAAIVAMTGTDPGILRVPGREGSAADALPSGPFDPRRHRTMEINLRSFVAEQTALELGYVEQLYTFGDRGRQVAGSDGAPHIVSVGYLALTRIDPDVLPAISTAGAGFRSWYDFLPWEDWRQGRPEMLDDHILPTVREWAARGRESASISRGLPPIVRASVAFGLDGSRWDDELALDRYEIIYSAGLVSESVRDGRYDKVTARFASGRSMDHDHRRILATAMSRLRSKLKYRPVIFELLPAEFTLTELQQTVESISGRTIHKQNFRRLVENAQLVEPTGSTSTATGGRPAAMFRFRREVLLERPSQGLRLGRRN